MAEETKTLIQQLAENFDGETTIYSLYEEWKTEDDDKQDLQYPLEKSDYKASVQFTPMKRDPVEVVGFIRDAYNWYQNNTGSTTNFLNRLTRSVFGDDLDAEDEAAAADLIQAVGEQQLTDNALGAFSSPLPILTGPFGKKCQIYLPQALQFRDNIAYNNLNLGLLGGQAASILNRGDANPVQAGVGAISGLLKMGLNNNTNSDLARVATTYGAQLLTPTQVSGAVRQLTRTTVAPNARTQFEAPNIRDFQFTFRFIPTSKNEAKTVQQIIKFFRYHMYPEKIPTGNDVEFPLGYNFPHMFDIKLMYGDNEMIDRNLKILPSYLISCDVNYNQTAMGFHEDGKFNEIEMALNFREEKALSREDVDEDLNAITIDAPVYNPSNTINTRGMA